VDNVVGRAFLITWPFDRFGLIDFHHEVFAGVPAPEAAP
jgi:signal peptidase I